MNFFVFYSMKRIIAILIAFLCLSSYSFAQRRIGFEFGSFTGVNYSVRGNARLSLDLRAGVSMNGFLDFEEGLTPTLFVFPKYMLFKESKYGTYFDKGYLGLNFLMRTPKWSIFGEQRSDRYGYTEPRITVGFAPTFGWVFPLNEISYINASLGVGLLWYQHKDQGGESYWQTSMRDRKFPILWDISYNYAF